MKLKAAHFVLFLLAVSFVGISCDRHKWGKNKTLVQEPSHGEEKHENQGKEGEKGAHEKKDGSEKDHP